MKCKVRQNYLKLVNTINVGPKLYNASKNFLIMEYLDGDKIGDWIQSLKGVGSAKKLKFVVRTILEDCYKLDQMKFDHGELSSISKHVIIGKSKVTLIDFESSSVNRRVSNVTSVTQADFYWFRYCQKSSKNLQDSTKTKNY